MRNVIFLLCFVPCFAFAQNIKIQYSKFINGLWGEWEKAYFESSIMNHTDYYYTFHGSVDDFYIYEGKYHPSNYIAHVIINDYAKYSLDEMKKMRKKSEWIEYDAEIEIFTSPEIFVTKFPYVKNHNEAPNGGIKKNVKLRMPARKKASDLITYNIYFDQKLGIGLSLPGAKASVFK